MRNYFADLPKYKCTVGAATIDAGGTMHRDIYFYDRDWDGEETEDEGYISALNLNPDVGITSHDPSRPMEVDALFIGLFSIWGGTYGSYFEKYVLVKLTERTAIQETFDAGGYWGRFTLPVHLGGRSLA